VSFFELPRPRVFGHRGAAGLAPENTLPSFALAAALGAPYLELDVHATRDGVIIVCHDPTVARTTNGTGAVADLTLNGLQRLDAGYHFTYDGRHFPYRGHGIQIPTLAAVLSAFPAHRLNIEIKQAAPPIVDAVTDVLRAGHATSRTLLAAERDDIMQAIRAAVGDGIVTSMSTGDVIEFMTRCAENRFNDYVPPGYALQIPVRYAGTDLITADTIAAAHRLGLEIHAWTINDAAEMRRLLALGVDGIMSDLPGLAMTIAGRRGT
jgi:glycerophosphoryl diester phosphodiesterase